VLVPGERNGVSLGDYFPWSAMRAMKNSMNTFRSPKALASGVGIAAAMLLFASSASLRADDENKKERRERPARPERSSPPAQDVAPARSATPPPSQSPAPPTRRERPAATPGADAPSGGYRSTENGTRSRGTRPSSSDGAANDSGIGTRPRPGFGTGTNPDVGSGIRPNPAVNTRTNPGTDIGGRSNTTGTGTRPLSTDVNRIETRPGTRTGSPDGRVIRLSNGNEVRRDTRGAVREVRAGERIIIHQPTGSQRVVVERPGRTVVVTNRVGYGYVQRPFVVRNQTYVQRTYYSRGVSYTRVYRPYIYGGVSFNVYTPIRYYPPAFYGWVYSPWVAPVPYRWSWTGSPWHTYYGGYFTPYPVYTSASLWLTDYLIAMTLEQAYRDRMEAAAYANAQANAAYGGQVALTPEVKQAIADEVRRQLAMENSERQNMTLNASYSNEPPPLFGSNGSHVFVVSSSLYVTSEGQECAISEGDVLQLNGGVSPNAAAADVVVLASKGQDCRKGSIVSVPLQDLQDMQNSMRETIDQGLGNLQSHQEGLPAPPSSALGAPTQASFFSAAPPPDPNIASELSQQAQEANQAEQEVVGQALPPASGTVSTLQPPNRGPVTISLGQTIDQVQTLLGDPKSIVDLGAKKMYLYKDLKITFTGGRVSDVQ
jgi:hypothetical protein